MGEGWPNPSPNYVVKLEERHLNKDHFVKLSHVILSHSKGHQYGAMPRNIFHWGAERKALTLNNSWDLLNLSSKKYWKKDFNSTASRRKRTVFYKLYFKI